MQTRRDVFLISQTHLFMVLCKDVCSVKSPEEILEIHGFFFFVLSVPFSILCCDKTVLIVRLGMVKKRNLVRVRKISRFGLNDLLSSSFGRHKHSWRS